jgi:anti-sigma regulatory factor (Ser/Thr protein kinase)
MPPQLCLPVTGGSQVGEIRRTAIRIGTAAALSPPRVSDAAIIATELATNLYRHARNGQVWLQTLTSPAPGCLEIVAVDSGPGIADLHRCLQDGYSTAGTPGNGLGAVRRLADEFDAFSTVGRGTVVFARLYANAGTPRGPFTIGAVSLPVSGEDVCGDTWRVVEQRGALALMIADGLGHGPLAAEAAEGAARVFLDRPFGEVNDFYARAHQALNATRGAAVARALVDGSGRVDYAGVGNIAGSLVSVEGSRGLASQNGTIGAVMGRHLASQQYDWPGRGILLMHSDGIMGRWSLDPYPGLLVRHPALIAAIIFRDFHRGRDDATIVVVARTGKGATE